MSIQLRVKHIFLFTYLFHKVSFDVTTLSCQCQKSFGEGEGQRRNRMCLSAQSKTLASHNQEGGEKGNGNKDTLRKKKKSANFHLLSCILFFCSLFISVACFSVTAAKQHQGIYKHDCLLKWNLTFCQSLAKEEP